MKLYRKLIRPMHSYPGPDYSPRIMPIEPEVKWYPEEEREHLEEKYGYLNEGHFSNLIFEEKYEPCMLKEQEDEKKRVMKVIWDTLHEGLSIDTIPDQDWVYELIRHRIEDT